MPPPPPLPMPLRPPQDPPSDDQDIAYFDFPSQPSSSSPSSSSPSQVEDPMQAVNTDLKETNTFLRKTIDGLEKEVDELREILFHNEVVFNDLIKSFSSLEKTAAKESTNYEAKMQQQKHQIQLLQERNKKALAPRVMKPYHEHAESQRTK